MEDKTGQLASYSVIKFPGSCIPKEYWNFILARWKRSYRHGNDYIALIDKASYYDAYDFYMTRVLNRKGVTTRIAVLTDDQDVALGFSVVENATLHYVYVQKDLRQKGIGRTLVPSEIDSFTHLTRTGMTLWSTKMPKAIFNPFI